MLMQQFESLLRGKRAKDDFSQKPVHCTLGKLTQLKPEDFVDDASVVERFITKYKKRFESIQEPICTHGPCKQSSARNTQPVIQDHNPVTVSGTVSHPVRGDNFDSDEEDSEQNLSLAQFRSKKLFHYPAVTLSGGIYARETASDFMQFQQAASVNQTRGHQPLNAPQSNVQYQHQPEPEVQQQQSTACGFNCYHNTNEQLNYGVCSNCKTEIRNNDLTVQDVAGQRQLSDGTSIGAVNNSEQHSLTSESRLSAQQTISSSAVDTSSSVGTLHLERPSFMYKPRSNMVTVVPKPKDFSISDISIPSEPNKEPLKSEPKVKRKSPPNVMRSVKEATVNINTETNNKHKYVKISPQKKKKPLSATSVADVLATSLKPMEIEQSDSDYLASLSNSQALLAPAPPHMLKELLIKTDSTINRMRKSYDQTQSRSRKLKSDTRRKLSVKDIGDNVRQLHRSILQEQSKMKQVEEDARQLELRSAELPQSAIADYVKRRHSPSRRRHSATEMSSDSEHDAYNQDPRSSSSVRGGMSSKTKLKKRSAVSAKVKNALFPKSTVFNNQYELRKATYHEASRQGLRSVGYSTCCGKTKAPPESMSHKRKKNATKSHDRSIATLQRDCDSAIVEYLNRKAAKKSSMTSKEEIEEVEDNLQSDTHMKLAKNTNSGVESQNRTWREGNVPSEHQEASNYRAANPADTGLLTPDGSTESEDFIRLKNEIYNQVYDFLVSNPDVVALREDEDKLLQIVNDALRVRTRHAGAVIDGEGFEHTKPDSGVEPAVTTEETSAVSEHKRINSRYQEAQSDTQSLSEMKAVHSAFTQQANSLENLAVAGGAAGSTEDINAMSLRQALKLVAQSRLGASEVAKENVTELQGTTDNENIEVVEALQMGLNATNDNEAIQEWNRFSDTEAAPTVNPSASESSATQSQTTTRGKIQRAGDASITVPAPKNSKSASRSSGSPSSTASDFSTEQRKDFALKSNNMNQRLSGKANQKNQTRTSTSSGSANISRPTDSSNSSRNTTRSKDNSTRSGSSSSIETITARSKQQQQHQQQRQRQRLQQQQQQPQQPQQQQQQEQPLPQQQKQQQPQQQQRQIQQQPQPQQQQQQLLRGSSSSTGSQHITMATSSHQSALRSSSGSAPFEASSITVTDKDGAKSTSGSGDYSSLATGLSTFLHSASELTEAARSSKSRASSNTSAGHTNTRSLGSFRTDMSTNKSKDKSSSLLSSSTTQQLSKQDRSSLGSTTNLSTSPSSTLGSLSERNSSEHGRYSTDSQEDVLTESKSQQRSSLSDIELEMELLTAQFVEQQIATNVERIVDEGCDCDEDGSSFTSNSRCGSFYSNATV